MKKLEENIKEVNEVMTNFDFCVDDFTDFNCLLDATTLITIERADLEKENQCIIVSFRKKLKHLFKSQLTLLVRVINMILDRTK